MAKNKIPPFLKDAEAAGEMQMIESIRTLLRSEHYENVLIAS
jgi:hypothetical protein